MAREHLRFDVRRIWDPEPEAGADEVPARQRGISAEVAFFTPKQRPSADEQSACRKRARAELREIAMSLKLRDTKRRDGIADRCARCGRCSDMMG